MKKKIYNFKNLTRRDLNIVRQIHITLLAKPKERCLKPWPDPKLEQTLPIRISHAALNAKPSKRTKMLFKSKILFQVVKKKPKKVTSFHYVSPAALKAQASDRIKKLSKPKRHLILKKKISKKTLLERKKKFNLFKKNREKWLQKNAQPKKIPPEPPIVIPKPAFAKKRPPLTPTQRIEIINKLSRPTRRVSKYSPNKKNKEPRTKLRVMSERIRELAIPKRIASETLRDLKFKPGQIRRAALKAVPCDRCKELATPKARSKAVDNDLRNDAFTIPRAALTYKASKRIIELAIPKKRN